MDREQYISSELIREALSATRWKYGSPPPLGLVTFVDRDKTRRKRDPGRCFLRAGGKVVGETKGGLVAIQFTPDVIPEAHPPLGAQLRLLETP